ncbi:HNH endonuclease signature motif containing protein [Streptomyces rubiginosohelvolus]|uniref:HNH endonuclease signature motif containing protein n=1 Tax=Streptomyces rubiginosohelvolus TaxID=67362 RepID=UPI003795316E
MAGNPRNGRPYRRLVAAVKALGDPCARCGQPIDPTLNARSGWSFTLDHIVPLSRGGSLLDPANARSMHRRCNSARGNRLTTAQPRASRRW